MLIIESLFFLDSFPFSWCWNLVHSQTSFNRSCPLIGSVKHKIKKTLSLLTSPHRASEVNLSSVEFKLTWPSPLQPVCSPEPFKWHRTHQRRLRKWYKPSPPRPGCKHKLPLRKEVGGGGGLAGEGRSSRWPQSGPATSPKKKKKKAVTECCVWARYKSQSCKTGSVYTAHPHKLASPCHPIPPPASHMLYDKKIRPLNERRRGDHKSSRWRRRYSEGGCFGWLSTKDEKWSLALGIKREKSQHLGEKTFYFLQFIPL